MTTALAVDELADYKLKVAVIARRYADDNGWCGVVDDALSELEAEQGTGAELLADAMQLHGELRDDAEEANRQLEELQVFLGADVTDLVSQAMSYHRQNHAGPARFCDHRMCQTADRLADSEELS